jgi:hypothetical protein
VILPEVFVLVAGELRAFSGKVDTGFPPENATNYRS